MTGFSTNQKLAVVDAVNGKNIRAANPESVKALLNAEIAFCAETYCGADNLSEELVKECVEFVIVAFASLSPREIRLSFKHAASTEIDLAAYHGKFTINILGKVLKAYTEYRRTIVAAYLKDKQTEAEALRVAQKSTDEDKQEFQNWCEAQEERLRELGDDATYNHVPIAIYKYLKEKYKFELSDEKKKLYWKDAAELAKVEYQREILNSNNPILRATNNKHIESINTHQYSDEAYSKILVIGQKTIALLVIHKLPL